MKALMLQLVMKARDRKRFKSSFSLMFDVASFISLSNYTIVTLEAC